MQWLASRWMRGSVLELEEGKVLLYPQRHTGPGLILDANMWRARVDYFALLLWVPFVLFAAPTEFIGAWLGDFFGPFFNDWHFALIVWFLVLAPIIWLLARRYGRLASEFCDKRDPADWDADLEKLKALEGIRAKEIVFYVFVVIILSPIIRDILDEVLLYLLAP